VGCYIWYSEDGTGRGRSPPRPLLAVPNVTVHPSTADVPITVLLPNGPMLCGFNVPTKGLSITPTSSAEGEMNPSLPIEKPWGEGQLRLTPAVLCLHAALRLQVPVYSIIASMQ